MQFSRTSQRQRWHWCRESFHLLFFVKFCEASKKTSHIVEMFHTNLSIVRMTRFHVDDTSRDHRKSFVYHSLQRASARNPVKSILLSCTVVNPSNNMNDAQKSIVLWNIQNQIKVSIYFKEITMLMASLIFHQDADKMAVTWVYSMGEFQLKYFLIANLKSAGRTFCFIVKRTDVKLSIWDHFWHTLF